MANTINLPDTSVPDSISILVTNYVDVINARQKTRELMETMGFSLLEQTRIVTAVSELARNIVVHAQGGKVIVSPRVEQQKTGVQCRFEDQGPGIKDVDQALKTGYSTTNSLGLGLSGAKNLAHEFHITSKAGKGTCITITQWLK